MNRELPGYVAVLLITIVGALAAYAIVYVGTTAEAEAAYVYVDPFDLAVDFGY